MHGRESNNAATRRCACPLSEYLKLPARPAAPTIDFPKANAELVKSNCFESLDFALQSATAGPDETVVIELGKDVNGWRVARAS